MTLDGIAGRARVGHKLDDYWHVFAQGEGGYSFKDGVPYVGITAGIGAKW